MHIVFLPNPWQGLATIDCSPESDTCLRSRLVGPPRCILQSVSGPRPPTPTSRPVRPCIARRSAGPHLSAASRRFPRSRRPSALRSPACSSSIASCGDRPLGHAFALGVPVSANGRECIPRSRLRVRHGPSRSRCRRWCRAPECRGAAGACGFCAAPERGGRTADGDAIHRNSFLSADLFGWGLLGPARAELPRGWPCGDGRAHDDVQPHALAVLL
eukprot:364902-Chlamydomonas_euryale.AAC.21